LTELTNKNYGVVMNLSVPSEKEVRTAYAEGEITSENGLFYQAE
jgi:hypothetical protein